MYACETPIIHIFEPKAWREVHDQSRYGVDHLALQIENFDAAKEWLKANSIEFDEKFMAS